MASSVAPLAGAWIEIDEPSDNYGYDDVAPLAGAWIEIYLLCMLSHLDSVAPLAGAWIEINNLISRFTKLQSLLSRERGLKF